jgi:quinoprotein dehydrogenase-associated probable ABC transporter substrate-binding protein
MPIAKMLAPRLSLLALALATAFAPMAASAQATGGAAPGSARTWVQSTWKTDKVLRVCGDPDNLPFSNDKQEGFENKIAAVLAQEMGDSLAYLWWPHRRGFVRNTLSAVGCDVLIGVPSRFDAVSATKPYYRSTYYIVTRQNRNLVIASLDDSLFRRLRVGVNEIGYDYTNTPPAQALAARKVGHLTGYSTFYNDDHRPSDIIDAVAKGDIDVALVWGPLAGYYASRAAVPLTLTALPDSDATSGIPFAFDVSIGVRRADRELKAALESAIERRRDDILKILETYHVPMLRKP